MTDVIDRVGELLNQLQSPDYFLREDAVRELATCDKDEAVAGLVLALEDPDLGIRELAANQLVRTEGPIAPQLLIRFLAHGDIGTRNLAAEILVKIGRPAVEPLVEHLADDDSDVRKFLVDVLGLIRDERAVGPLCDRLWDDNLNVVCSAAEALGEIGSTKAVEPLLAAYDRVEEARLQAVEALGKIGGTVALSRLYEIMQSEDALLVYAAIEATGNIGERESVARLAPFLQQEASLAEAALTAIINISDRHAGRIDCDLPLDRFVGFLFDRIRAHDRKITQFTLSRLPRWYGNDVVRQLLDVVDAVGDEELERIREVLRQAGPSTCGILLERFAGVSVRARCLFLEIIGEFIDEEVARQLLPLTADPEPEVRQVLALVLGRSGHPVVAPSLRKLAMDEIGHVRSAAYTALGWVCAESEVDFLFSGLNDPYPDVREAAMGALILVGGPQVVAKFTADLYHQQPDRQRLAVKALGMIGEPEVVDSLVKAVNHPEPGVRRSAIETLGRIGHLADPAPLIMGLSDEVAAVRKAAVTALTAMQGEEAVHEIRLLLDDPDVWVCYHTINTIGSLGKTRFGELIMPYLSSDQDIVRIAATNAVAQMRCTKALALVRNLVTDKNGDLARAARAAVETLEGVH